VIHQRFGRSVSPIVFSQLPFFLVAPFGRYHFCLCLVLVGRILQATIGGLDADFDVLQLADRVFRFSVVDKRVGFHILKLSSFTSCYKLFFHLWSNGGPRWEFEFAAYCKEEASSWSEIKKSTTSHNIASFFHGQLESKQ
jgi:hypothetical protein